MYLSARWRESCKRFRILFFPWIKEGYEVFSMDAYRGRKGLSRCPLGSRLDLFRNTEQRAFEIWGFEALIVPGDQTEAVSLL